MESLLQLFDLVYEYAVRAFNLSTTHDSQLLTTRMKLTASYLSISCAENESGLMMSFSQLDPSRKMEIAETFKGYLDDLLDKVRVHNTVHMDCTH